MPSMTTPSRRSMLSWLLSARTFRITGLKAFFFTVLSVLLIWTVRSGYTAAPDRHGSKLAILIESRPLPHLAPLLLHFIYSLPLDWRVQFMGSHVSIDSVNKSASIREKVYTGRLDLTYIPPNMTVDSQEAISRFLTTLYLYDTLLRPAEHLLVFQADSMICANSRKSVNDFLEYDWIGAPWHPNGNGGGNGGLSLRRVRSIIAVLQEAQRADWSQPEDVWFSEHLRDRPGSRLANGSISMTFSGEGHRGQPESLIPTIATQEGRPSEDGQSNTEAGSLLKAVDGWRDGHYEPMGYHLGIGQRLWPEIWGTPDQREHIWKYCPEVKLILDMDMADFVPGTCNENF